MNISEALTRDKVLAEALTWLDTPFRHQGRLRKNVDCVGLLKGIAQGVGVQDPTPDVQNYPRRPPTGQSFLQYFDDHLIKVSDRALAVGRIATFKDPVFACHTGLIGKRASEFTLIHASSTRGKVVQDFFYQQGWDKKLISVYEFPGLEGVPA